MFSLTTSAFATGSNDYDVMQDLGNTRTQTRPTREWDWSDGTYTGHFDVSTFTYTNYCFEPNDEGKLYYCITGTSTKNKTCTVKSICKTCNDELTSFEFLPSETPAHRVVSLGDHSEHLIYFEIRASSGWIWDVNDITGTIEISPNNI